MKNVTITVEDDALQWARIEAAKRNTSVSRMLGEMIAEKRLRDDAYQRTMSDALKFEPLAFSAAQYPNRDDIYGERLARFR